MTARSVIRVSLVSAIVTAGLAATPAMATPPALRATSPVRTSAVAADDHSDWATVRGKFGFAHDQSTMDTVAANIDKTTSSDIGVPLRSDEHAEMVRRYHLGNTVGAIEAAGKGSDSFGGVRVNQAAGGVVEILVTGPGEVATALGQKLTALVPSGNPATVISVPYPIATLDDAFQQINRDFDAGQLSDLGVTTIDQQTSLITIGLGDSAPADAETRLKELFPWPYISFSRTAGQVDWQSRSFTSGPLYGGEWTQSDTGNQCTVGYSDMYYSSSGTFWTATAGHCGDPGDYWHQGLGAAGNHYGHGGAYNGARGSWSYGTTRRCDCQVIGVTPTGATTFNMFNSGNALYAFDRTPSNTSTDFYPGRAVCVSGAAFGEDHNNSITCGSITNVNYSVLYSPNQVFFEQLVHTDITNTESGDSGGPVASYHDFMGIHSGLGGGYEFFSRSTYLGPTTTAYPVYV